MKKKAVMSILACIMCIGIAAGCSNTGIMAVTDNTAISQIETSGEKNGGATETGASDHEGLSVEEAMVADYEEEHYPILPLTLAETLQLRMEEMGVRDGDTVSMYDLMFEYKD